MILNEEQSRAVHAADGPVMVLAGPGTGKTAVIAGRVKELLDRGVPGHEILVITFTRAAAREMEERFGILSRNKGENSPPRFGTFHSVFYEILRESGLYRGSRVCTEAEKEKWMREILERREAEKGFPELAGDRNGCIRVLLEEFSARKAGLPRQVAGESRICGKDLFEELFQEYEKMRIKSSRLDFDDMITECLKLLKTRKAEREKWQKRFRYLLVDEFQDANRMQYEAAKMLALPENNLFVVGDDDQSIYGFRGADPGIMRSFTHDFPAARIIALRINYRSKPEIYEKAANLIRRNKNRFAKEIICAREKDDRKEERPEEDKCLPNDRKEENIVEYLRFPDVREEAEFVVRKVKELNGQGLSWENMAVLYRSETVRDPILYSLRLAGIPVECKEPGFFFYDHWMIRDIVSYLRLAAGRGSLSDLLHVINRPERMIGRTAVEYCWGKACEGENTAGREKMERFFTHLLAYYAKKGPITRRVTRLRDELHRMGGMAPSAAIVYVLLAVEYEKYMKQACSIFHTEVNDARELVEECKERARQHRTLDQMLDGIEWEKRQLALVASPEEKGVVLMTMHGSKGLEFPAVFLPSLNEGILPHSMAGEEDGVEEERRVFYVAMTRARDRLYLSCTEKRSEHRPPASRFLAEAGLSPVERSV